MQMKHSERVSKGVKTRSRRPNVTPLSSYLFKFSRQTKLERKKAPFENVRSCLYMTRVQIFRFLVSKETAWCCVGGRDQDKNLVLSNELIKVE